MNTGRGGRKIALNTTSDPSTLAPIRLAIEQLAGELGFGEESVGQLGLVVNEAMANVIRHAYGGRTDRPVEVTAEAAPPDGIRPGGIQIVIRDWGNGVDPSKLPPKPRDPMNPGGLGLICMAEMMDDVKFEPQHDGMRLVMIKRLNSTGEKGTERSHG